jgi:predicted RNA polymerase sigma factor
LRRVARHKAIDRLRREARRVEKEVAAFRQLAGEGEPPTMADDELALIFLCCHPALDPGVQVSLTLRAVCGLTTGEIAAAFLLPEATMAKRLVRAKRKIRDSSIPLRVPSADELGLVILDTIAVHPQLARWPQLHIARADLLRRSGRPDEAVAAYRHALELEPPPAERSFIHRRIRQLQSHTC